MCKTRQNMRNWHEKLLDVTGNIARSWQKLQIAPWGMDRFHRCLRRSYARNGQTSQLIKESIGDLLGNGILQGQQCRNNCSRNTKIGGGCRRTGTDRGKKVVGEFIYLFARKQGQRQERTKIWSFIKFLSRLFSVWTCKLWCVKGCDSLANIRLDSQVSWMRGLGVRNWRKDMGHVSLVSELGACVVHGYSMWGISRAQRWFFWLHFRICFRMRWLDCTMVELHHRMVWYDYTLSSALTPLNCCPRPRRNSGMTGWMSMPSSPKGNPGVNWCSERCLGQWRKFCFPPYHYALVPQRESLLRHLLSHSASNMCCSGDISSSSGSQAVHLVQSNGTWTYQLHFVVQPHCIETQTAARPELVSHVLSLTWCPSRHGQKDIFGKTPTGISSPH